jgi:Flp pilus assembly protein TadD
MEPDNNLTDLIRNRDVKGILRMMFRGEPPTLQTGYNREDQLWDFKEQCPALGKGNEAEWAKISADVLAFHNQEGGIIFFGIRNADYRFVGVSIQVDTKLFNDKIRKYCGDRFWVSFSREHIRSDQKYLGIAIIPPKAYAHQRVLRDGPLQEGRPTIKTGDLCIRIGDQTKVLRGSEAIEYAATKGLGVAGATYAVSEANFKVMRPDYKQFIKRSKSCDEIEKAIRSQRTYVTSLTGIGGVGKTALACWMTLQAYEKKWFDFIVSVSARDRILTSEGIIATASTFSSLDDLLHEICETTGFAEFDSITSFDERLRRIKEDILGQFNGFLFVDNLETVDDPRRVQFLEDLPMPTKAIVTSRRARIRVSNYPVEVGPFDEREAVEFLDETSRSAGKDFVAEMTSAEKKVIVDACDRIPLVMEWLVGRVKAPDTALSVAHGLAKEGRHGEELLEFSFRRIYEDMTGEQRSVLKVLALTNRPLPIEAVSVGSDLVIHQAADVVEELKDYSLIERIYDTNYRDLVYSLLPVTSSFVYRDMSKQAGAESDIRKRLNDWYQARDIKDQTQRDIVQKVRRGERNPELALLEVAKNFLKQNDLENAESYFKQALERNPRNWQCHREAAEFYRHHRGEVAQCLRHYEEAAQFCPKQGPDRAKIYREWGMVLRGSGMPSALRDAAERLKVALTQTPNDFVCRHALGDCYVKMGAFEPALEVLEPLKNHSWKDTRQRTYPLLEQCYKATNRILELATLKQKIAEEMEAQNPSA